MQAYCRCGAAIPQHLLDHGIRTSQLAMLGELLPGFALLGVMVTVVLAMHQDPIPGARQDWLVRPIRRMDLAAAKLLFVLLMVQAPLLVVDGRRAGRWFPALPQQSPRPPHVHHDPRRFALPAAVLGAVTRSTAEAIIVAIVAWILFCRHQRGRHHDAAGHRSDARGHRSQWLFIAAIDEPVLIGSIVLAA